MRVDAVLWTGVGAFFVSMGVLYTWVGGDRAGITLLFVASGLGGLVAGWIWRWRSTHDARATDQADIDASDRTGVVGVYPTASLRPVALALGVSALVAGVAVGSWLSMVGFGLVVSQVVLLVRDLDT